MPHPSIILKNGLAIPQVGFGTYKIEPGESAERAIAFALECGYRHIDTAAIYGNEESVGKAIRTSGIARSDIFITTKLWNEDHTDPEQALNESVKRLQTEYVDLYLIHWPVRSRNASWKTLERLYAQGLCKAIGVSNFTIRHLDELLGVASIIPLVNQVEFHPYVYQKELLEYCIRHSIQIEAYAPLTRGVKLDEGRIVRFSKQYGKTPAQIMLRWGIQHGLIVLPKSTNRDHIKSNLDIFDFELRDEDMIQLDGIGRTFRKYPDPENMP